MPRRLVAVARRPQLESGLGSETPFVCWLWTGLLGMVTRCSADWFAAAAEGIPDYFRPAWTWGAGKG